MASTFKVLHEEFEEELKTVRALVEAFPARGSPQIRIAAANAATLLLAATFEQFIREMARAYAKAIVTSQTFPKRMPRKLMATAWKRTMEALARLKFDGQEGLPADALARFNVVYEFCKGDRTQDIYQDLIHNENNMRASEINSLFNVSELSNVCALICSKRQLMDLFDEVDSGVVNGLVVKRLEAFIERRNLIAHSISAMSSSSPDELQQDIEFIGTFGLALAFTLEEKV